MQPNIKILLDVEIMEVKRRLYAMKSTVDRIGHQEERQQIADALAVAYDACDQFQQRANRN